MKIDLSTLNKNQLDAVQWGDGPLLVLAGPGSGKTRVLTLRIARLLAETSDERFKILGITFTNKASAEMRERLINLVEANRERLLVTTFHSFAADILRQHGNHFGLKPDFTILSQAEDREAVLCSVLREIGDEEESTTDASRLLPAIDALLNRQISQGSFGETTESMRRIADKYLERLLISNQLDFPALLIVCIKLLKEKPFIVQQIRRVYKYICVDEFQDTNSGQYELLTLISNENNPNLFIVADDDQMIFQWNGASPRRLEMIYKDYGMKMIQLPENYRCPPEVIEMANSLIICNRDRSFGKQQLVAHKVATGSRAVSLLCYENADAELAGITDTIARLTPKERAESAVLARTRKMLEQISISLIANGIPAHISSRKTEFQSAPIRLEYAILKLANSRQDKEFLRRVCKAFYELEGVEFSSESIIALAPQFSGDFFRSWIEAVLSANSTSGAIRSFLGSAARPLLEKNDFVCFMAECSRFFDENAKGLSDAYRSPDFIEEQATWKSLRFDIEAKFGRENLTLNAFLQELDMSSKEPAPPTGAVRCLTIHTAKGLEFSHVFLMGMAEEILPSWAAVKKGDESAEMREERRNCFVAITRVENHLTLSYAKRYNGYAKAPSRFLIEMGLIKQGC